MKYIEYTAEVKKSFKEKCKIVLSQVAGLAVVLVITIQVWESHKEVKAEVKEFAILDFKIEKKSVKDLVIEIAPKYQIPTQVMQALIDVESAGVGSASRFEEHHMARVEKYCKGNYTCKVNAASSHGVAQIMGWHALERGMRWDELYDDETNIELASSILKSCYDKQKSKNNYGRWLGAFKCYNGSDTYANLLMQRVAGGFLDA